jgi:hypothetical protein
MKSSKATNPTTTFSIDPSSHLLAQKRVDFGEHEEEHHHSHVDKVQHSLSVNSQFNYSWNFAPVRLDR